MGSDCISSWSLLIFLLFRFQLFYFFGYKRLNFGILTLRLWKKWRGASSILTSFLYGLHIKIYLKTHRFSFLFFRLEGKIVKLKTIVFFCLLIRTTFATNRTWLASHAYFFFKESYFWTYFLKNLFFSLDFSLHGNVMMHQTKITINSLTFIGWEIFMLFWKLFLINHLFWNFGPVVSE